MVELTAELTDVRTVEQRAGARAACLASKWASDWVEQKGAPKAV